MAELEQHAQQLAASLRRAQERTAEGSLKVHGSAPDTLGLEDEEEYALRQRLKQSRKALDELQAPNLALEKGGAKRPRTSAVLAEMRHANTKAFLQTLRRRDVLEADEVWYGKDGLDRQDLPISAEGEPLECLEELKAITAQLAGIAITKVRREEADEGGTRWELGAHAPVDAGKQALRFSAAFHVRAEDDANGVENGRGRQQRIVKLELGVPDVARVELAPLLAHCQSSCCLRTFCQCASQYAELYVARAQLFKDAVRRFPKHVRIGSSAELREGLSEAADTAACVLHIRGTPPGRCCLVWAPFFTFQRVADEGDARKLPRAIALRPRLELWRAKAGVAGPFLDEGFGTLVRLHGLADGLDRFLRAYVPAEDADLGQ